MTAPDPLCSCKGCVRRRRMPQCDRCHLPIEGDEPHDQLVNGEHVVFHPDCCPDCQENDE